MLNKHIVDNHVQFKEGKPRFYSANITELVISDTFKYGERNFVKEIMSDRILLEKEFKNFIGLSGGRKSKKCRVVVDVNRNTIVMAFPVNGKLKCLSLN